MRWPRNDEREGDSPLLPDGKRTNGTVEVTGAEQPETVERYGLGAVCTERTIVEVARGARAVLPVHVLFQ